jgi:hypothetical protein
MIVAVCVCDGCGERKESPKPNTMPEGWRWIVINDYNHFGAGQREWRKELLLCSPACGIKATAQALEDLFK